MKRRSFFLSGGTTLAMAGASCSNMSTPGSELPAVPGDSPSGRTLYASAMLDLLCTVCGPRPAGSEGYDRAADLVRRDFERSAAAEYHTYTFERWLPLSDPDLMIGEEPVNAFYGIGCSPTPPEGIHGVLRPGTGRVQYEIADSGTGELLAYLSPTPLGNAERARSVGTFGLPTHCPPFVIVGTYTEGLLKRAVEESLPVKLTASTEFTPDVPISNVIATIPGASTDEVLVVGHLDTVYPSPGANDNAGSVVLILMLAHALAGTKPKHTLRFMASADEETGSHGMEAYIRHRREDGTFDRIVSSINFDSATWGPNIELISANSETRRVFEEIDRDFTLPGVPDIKDGNIYTMDNRWFKDALAVDAVTVGSSGYDNKLFCWHRPNDIPENVPMDCVENTFRIFREYFARTEGV